MKLQILAGLALLYIIAVLTTEKEETYIYRQMANQEEK
jgi:hypothetical protein